MNPNFPVSRRYTTAISKGAGLIEETRQLLKQWAPDESCDSFALRVQHEGILGNATAYRTKDIVKRVFIPRFLRPTDKPARILKKILSTDLPWKTYLELLFLYAARNDNLVYDIALNEYWPSVRRGQTLIESNQLLSFLSEAHYNNLLGLGWSEKVSLRVSRSILGLFRDVGFVRESIRGRRELVNYHMSDEGVAILARELNEAGVTDSSLCDHPDWSLFGMYPAEVAERLDEIGEHRGVIVQRAGSVVHFTWGIKSIEELIDVLAR